MKMVLLDKSEQTCGECGRESWEMWSHLIFGPQTSPAGRASSLFHLTLLWFGSVKNGFIFPTNTTLLQPEGPFQAEYMHVIKELLKGKCKVNQSSEVIEGEPCDPQTNFLQGGVSRPYVELQIPSEALVAAAVAAGVRFPPSICSSTPTSSLYAH